MINPKQLRDLITRTLKDIPSGYSEDAVELLMMIAAHESKLGTYLKQVNGPALGIFQIEPATHDDVWEHGDSAFLNSYHLDIGPLVERLEYDLRYQIFMARQRLFMKPEALPSADNLIAMAEYSKKHWNTVHGKATAEDYLNAYLGYSVR